MRKRRRAQDVRHEILHEAAVLLLARPSTRIVSLHQLYETTSEIILVLELAEGGELQRVIDEEESLEEGVVRRYMINILGALRFLHAHNIAHLDLKPQNLLLMGKHPESDVKLCDFGISRIILSDIEVREVLGTPDYVAPEILQYEPISLATDMWSVGVLTYVLLTGHSPFGGDTKQETFLNISQGQVDFPKDLFCDVSEQAIDFITRLLLVNPSCRLTVDEALQHQWLNGLYSSHPLTSPSSSTTHQSSREIRIHTPNSTAVTSQRQTKELDTQNTSPKGIAPFHCSSPSKENISHSVMMSATISAVTPSCSKDASAQSNNSTVSSMRLIREPELYAPSTSSMHLTKVDLGCVGSSSHISREGIVPWRKSEFLNKENNKNTLNKTEELVVSGHSKEVVTLDSPSKSRSRLVHTEKGKLIRESDLAKKLASNKEGKENKENGKEIKDCSKEKLKPSALCLRRQGSKCDLKSPTEQQKYGSVQGSVSIILEKSIIC
ncbi:serine/threonine-protein kinase 17A-like isoform X2 [Homarus americanus]|nr:serine/threonine-protein kinase 17A-like isoform X2 [Homarus americanus]XP_042235572.1 serine/threonine-protein kinase 17A-like isoform X2 [Homarus americanus]